MIFTLVVILLTHFCANTITIYDTVCPYSWIFYDQYQRCQQFFALWSRFEITFRYIAIFFQSRPDTPIRYQTKFKFFDSHFSAPDSWPHSVTKMADEATHFCQSNCSCCVQTTRLFLCALCIIQPTLQILTGSMPLHRIQAFVEYLIIIQDNVYNTYVCVVVKCWKHPTCRHLSKMRALAAWRVHRCVCYTRATQINSIKLNEH